jgi:hypothetical protein
MFSDASWRFDKYYTNFLLTAYQAASNTGKKIGFVNEDEIDKLNDGEMLIVPNAVYVPKSTVTAVNEFAKRGNDVILLSKCMDYDELGQKQEAAGALNELYNNCEIYGFNPIDFFSKTFEKLIKAIDSILSIFNIQSLGSFLKKNRNCMTILLTLTKFMLPWYVNQGNLQKVILDLQSSTVMLKNAWTGQVVKNVEWKSVEYQGRLLINICNLSTQAIKNVNVYINGEKVTSYTDLISETALTGKLTLNSYKPLLLSVDISQ